MLLIGRSPRPSCGGPGKPMLGDVGWFDLLFGRARSWSVVREITGGIFYRPSLPATNQLSTCPRPISRLTLPRDAQRLEPPTITVPDEVTRNISRAPTIVVCSRQEDPTNYLLGLFDSTFNPRGLMSNPPTIRIVGDPENSPSPGTSPVKLDRRMLGVPENFGSA